MQPLLGPRIGERITLERAKNGARTEPVDLLPPDDLLFGRSAAMAEVRQRATKICNMNVAVLLQGGGGSGKEVLARWIHKHSATCAGQFVKVNCATIPGTLLESELFGYEKGAFTGAHISKPGRVEAAHKGTLFLDEIADMDASLQSKLLHFLQDGRFSRIGDREERLVETRLICATHRNLEKEIDSGAFRADLYYRINVIHIKLPRLSARNEDIPYLAEYFRVLYQEKYEKQAEPFRAETLRLWQEMAWPGNIRELANGIARHVLLGTEADILHHAPLRRPLAATTKERGDARVSLKQIAKDAVRKREKDLILGALQANQWNRRKTAELLKISYRTLIYKIRDAGFTAKRAKHSALSEPNQAATSHPGAD
ncbi:MAG: sigma 54-interacting transcriptional regulator [Candidatus Acidiferrum sp.]